MTQFSGKLAVFSQWLDMMVNTVGFSLLFLLRGIYNTIATSYYNYCIEVIFMCRESFTQRHISTCEIAHIHKQINFAVLNCLLLLQEDKKTFKPNLFSNV